MCEKCYGLSCRRSFQKEQQHEKALAHNSAVSHRFYHHHLKICADFVLSFGQEPGWTSPLLLSSLILGCLALASLPFIESRVANLIIKFSLLHNRMFVSTIVCQVLSFLALFSLSFLLPYIG
ncbi:hypothetical protein EPA93_31545 [Ktedonosporobacter rubrisoli]|uniref:Uncharacterized protein n=1 Tax=Ktedonosporobacter rubrisoli TaxID=2509675 RepID=A0A4P6JXY7_KTERU|nr:hypothetical protein [Ktedonosporobacter rubrisoli]QBD80270.1 hypothetical protein EPA93_31545 [Ktedonosporobacter rubrisoli]